MFKDTIPIGPKSINELIDLLAERVDIMEIATSDLADHIMRMAMFNASHCILNDDLHMKPDSMSFLVFKIIQNEKSSQYSSEISQNEFIYVIFETHIGYIFSNSNRLFLELELLRGVSQHEYDTEGNQFKSLISHLAIAYCEEHTIED